MYKTCYTIVKNIYFEVDISKYNFNQFITNLEMRIHKIFCYIIKKNVPERQFPKYVCDNKINLSCNNNSPKCEISWYN